MTQAMTQTRFRNVARELRADYTPGDVLTRDAALRLANRHHVALEQIEAIAATLDIESVEALMPAGPGGQQTPSEPVQTPPRPASRVDPTARRAILTGSAYRLVGESDDDAAAVVISWGMFRRERELIVTWLAELGDEQAREVWEA